jgi:hypothetical protein
MPHYKVAHLHEQGQDMIIVPLASSFGSKTQQDQLAFVAEFQRRAVGAGLRGRVVPVWQTSGRMSFIAPPQWHPFFQSIGMNQIAANINREISW